MGNVVLSYDNGNYYAQYGNNTASKKVLGEINKIDLINALANSGLGLTPSSTPAQIYAALNRVFPLQPCFRILFPSGIEIEHYNGCWT